MNKSLSSRTMLIVSMAVFGTIGLFVRNINLPSGEIALYRAVLAALLIGIFLLTENSIYKNKKRIATTDFVRCGNGL